MVGPSRFYRAVLRMALSRPSTGPTPTGMFPPRCSSGRMVRTTTYSRSECRSEESLGDCRGWGFLVGLWEERSLLWSGRRQTRIGRMLSFGIALCVCRRQTVASSWSLPFGVSTVSALLFYRHIPLLYVVTIALLIENWDGLKEILLLLLGIFAVLG